MRELQKLPLWSLTLPPFCSELSLQGTFCVGSKVKHRGLSYRPVHGPSPRPSCFWSPSLAHSQPLASQTAAQRCLWGPASYHLFLHPKKIIKHRVPFSSCLEISSHHIRTNSECLYYSTRPSSWPLQTSRDEGFSFISTQIFLLKLC